MHSNTRPRGRRRFIGGNWVGGAGLGLALCLTPTAAVAQGNRAAAIVLFDEAERLLAVGRVREACEKFGESHRLDPQIGALLHYADCEERSGKLATAYAAFRDALELATSRSDPRAAVASSRAAAIEPRLPRVQFELTEPGLPGISIALDGTRLEDAAFGTALPLDPGEHQVLISAPGYRPWSVTMSVNTEGRTERVFVPALTPAAAAESASTTPPQVWSYTALGLSAVALGAGVVFVVSATSKADEYDRICPRNVDCEPGTNQRLQSLEGDVVLHRNLSILSFAGGATLATLGLLWLDTDSTEAAKRSGAITSLGISAAPHGDGPKVTVRGRF